MHGDGLDLLRSFGQILKLGMFWRSVLEQALQKELIARYPLHRHDEIGEEIKAFCFREGISVLEEMLEFAI